MSVASFNNGLRAVSEGPRTVVVKVYGYEDKDLRGTLHILHDDREIPFQNLMKLLLALDDLMDEQGRPQATVESRQFGKRKKMQEAVSPNEPPREERAVLATFTIHVLFRHQASWQGKIGWKEGRKEENFRSALELVKLMDSALTQTAECITEEAG